MRKLAVSENPPLTLPNSAARPLFDGEDVEYAADVDALFGDRCRLQHGLGLSLRRKKGAKHASLVSHKFDLRGSS